MPFTRYDIYFSGQIISGRDPAQVKKNVARLFKIDPEKVQRLFTGKTTRIKANVDQDAAIRYRSVFTKAGALIDIRPVKEGRSATANTRPQPPSSGREGLSLQAANTGTLADCTPAVEPAAIPDISGMALLPPGPILDGSGPVPEAKIDTSGLSLNPPQEGSLADCHTPPRPAPIPDTENIQLAPANSGSLEDCHIEPDAPPIPDISNLQLYDSDDKR